MRISVRLCSKAFRGSLEFSRSVRRAPNAPKVGTLSRMFSLPTSSPREAVLEVVGAVKKKRKLSLGRRPASSRSFRVTASSEQNAGILTRFPFVAGNDLLRTCPKTRPIVPFSKLIYDLGSIDPRPTAVLVEPSSTSALRRFSLVFATTTKICTRGRCTPGRPASFSATSTFAYSLSLPRPRKKRRATA